METSTKIVHPQGSRLLSAHLEGRGNNLDLLRLIAAAMVILGHSYAVVGSGTDPVAAWNGSVYSGLFSVHVFFFISGMLVTNSFLRKPDVVTWLSSRALRILPGLFVCMIVTVFIMGTLLTKIPVVQYLTSRDTWDYFLGNILVLRTRFYLPGVFAGNFDHAVNGPLWSLYLEVRLYLAAAILLWVFRGRPRLWLTSALAVLAIGGMLYPEYLTVLGGSGHSASCALMFVIGALCALWSEQVLISPVWLIALFVAVCHYTWTAAFQPLFLLFTCYLVLWFGFSQLFLKIRLPGDFSYGLYIYGWPVQQLMVMWFPKWPPVLNTIFSLIGAIALGAVSWYLVEKPSLAKKKAIHSLPGLERKLVPAFAVGCCALILLASVPHLPRLSAVPTASSVAPKPAAVPVAPVNARSQPAVQVADNSSIQDFGPHEAIAGHPFNVQQNGLSAIWVRLDRPSATKSSIVFRGQQLDTVASANVLTASVPNELIAHEGAVEIYVADEVGRRTSSVKMAISGSKRD